MVDLNRLTAPALKAALVGGTDGWRQAASIRDVRYAEAYPKGYRRRRMCRCGCSKRSTHMGMAKGIALYSGCELTVARWVRDPDAAFAARKATTANSVGTKDRNAGRSETQSGSSNEEVRG